jgi:hypothetical protein
MSVDLFCTNGIMPYIGLDVLTCCWTIYPVFKLHLSTGSFFFFNKAVLFDRKDTS